MRETKRNKILASARVVFLRYGYKRVNMNDIAAAAGVSRPALYLLFRNKEEIFVGVYRQWVDETLLEIKKETARIATPEKRIERAFEIWSVRPFALVMTSPEARELLECSFAFAEDPLKEGYAKFEAAIVSDLESLCAKPSTKAMMPPQKVAHILASAVRGFKQTATTPDELRHLIRDLLLMVFRSRP